MLVVRNLIVTLQNNTLLDAVSCSLIPGRITLFVGKSGAGKTTLLRSMAGLVPYREGTILIDDVDIAQLPAQQRAQRIGFVFQDFNLFTNRTVLENCADPLEVQKVASEIARQRAIHVLQELEMHDYLNVYPAELSGGQKQRVAIARALCLQPQVLLLDEPTASLDPINSAILIQILKTLARQGLTIALSSQDTNFIRALFDRAYYLQSGTIVEAYEEIAAVDQDSLIAQFI